ncbi:uncharacterized protein EV154DRAFT_413140 [Mucor mucedo]|uniref:uncharacterized protein n=1 Tax=Mucor mucedo TaxID=29922 RepID=UPI00221F7B40|nr:uncharacterized protein EV154DRAFT_413140 [Mucor mucedo]KAI7895502.1 hypothetical protein EV154DRAFT_413140 [Mucor mucedo]
MVKQKQVGGLVDLLHHPLVLKHLTSHPETELVYSNILHSSMIDYPQEFLQYQNLFETDSIDLVICDSFAVSCIDSAMVSKIPVIITTTTGTFFDNGARYINNLPFTTIDPSTQHESPWKRLYRNWIRYPKFMHELEKKLDYVCAFQQKFGLRPSVDVSTAKYNDIPKIINNVFGIEIARAHSPLVHLIGPVMRNDYPSFDNTTLDYLNSHHSVAYVAFGQHAVPSNSDVHMIMQTLVILLEKQMIDGIIWARLNKDQLPELIKTSARRYSLRDILDHKDIYLPRWAPQFAILQHPSTSFFLSHGGVGSLHEALFNRKKLFIYPFFGDQPVNAMTIDRLGVGKYLDTTNLNYNYQDYQTLYERLSMLAVDPQKKIQDKLDRYSAFIQGSAIHAVVRGADIMEESLFASDDSGKLSYRRDVGYDIHWMKKNDIDIYALVVILCFIALKTGYIVYINMSEAKYSKLHKKMV